jgi:hypothetical protein
MHHVNIHHPSTDESRPAAAQTAGARIIVAAWQYNHHAVNMADSGWWDNDRQPNQLLITD